MLFVCYVAVRLSYLIPIHSDILSAVAFFRAGIFLERSINTALNIGFCIRPVCRTHNLTEIHNNNTKKLNKKKTYTVKEGREKSTSHKQNL